MCWAPQPFEGSGQAAPRILYTPSPPGSLIISTLHLPLPWLLLARTAHCVQDRGYLSLGRGRPRGRDSPGVGEAPVGHRQLSRLAPVPVGITGTTCWRSRTGKQGFATCLCSDSRPPLLIPRMFMDLRMLGKWRSSLKMLTLGLSPFPGLFAGHFLGPRPCPRPPPFMPPGLGPTSALSGAVP